MTESAVMTKPAMQIIVRTPAKFLMIHAGSRPCAAQSNIDQYVAALLDGLEVLLTNATNVGFLLILFIIPKFNLDKFQMSAESILIAH